MKEEILGEKKVVEPSVPASRTIIKRTFLNYSRLFRRNINCKISNIMERTKKSIKLGIFVEEQEKIFHIVFCFIITDKRTNLESWPVICVLQHNRKSEVSIGEYINVWMKGLLYHIGKQHLYPKKTSDGWMNVFSSGVVPNKALLPPAFNSGHYRLAYEKREE
jgi:hypothetical protein